MNEEKENGEKRKEKEQARRESAVREQKRVREKLFFFVCFVSFGAAC